MNVVILLLVCLLQFGNYFAYDAPASLNLQLQKHLHMDYNEWQYCLNLLFVFYSLPNTILPFWGGKFTDRFGCRGMLVVCGALNLGGQVLVNVGLVVRNIPLVMLGRLLFGIGGESVSVAQAVMISHCFEGKSLLLATSMSAFFSKLGSIVNAILSPLIDRYFGIETAIFGATLACALSFAASVVLFGMTGASVPLITAPSLAVIPDETTPLQTGDTIPNHPAEEAESLGIRETLSHLPVAFWVVCLVYTMFCGPYYCFNNTALDFLVSKWYLNDTVTAGLAMSIPGTVSTGFLTICGSLLNADYHGSVILLLSLITITVIHLLLGFTPISPIIPFIGLGVMGAINLTLTYPFVNRIIKRHEHTLRNPGSRVAVKMLGAAYGICGCAMNLSLTLIPLCVAWILTASADAGGGGVDGDGLVKWSVLEVFYSVLSGVGVGGAVWLVFDGVQGT
ncbi:major facilitator superfamily domain-containing protein [Obelidium mucronatum]|nr:major facilitator superfamily domain-containing protein [Obelidium mucronatum]